MSERNILPLYDEDGNLLVDDYTKDIDMDDNEDGGDSDGD